MTVTVISGASRPSQRLGHPIISNQHKIIVKTSLIWGNVGNKFPKFYAPEKPIFVQCAVVKELIFSYFRTSLE